MKKKRGENSYPNCLGTVLFTFVILVVMAAIIMFRLNNAIQSLNETFEPISTLDAKSLLTPVTGCLEQWGTENLASIEQAAGIIFPESASNITASSVAFMDCSINVRFTMAASDLDTFLVSSYVDELVPRTGSTLFVQQNYDVDWNFDSEKLYLYGQGDKGNMEYQNIVVDTSNESIYIVYIITSLL